MARRRLPPFEVEIERLGPKAVGQGTAPDGRPVQVRGVPLHARAMVQITGRKKGAYTARRLHLVRPPPDPAEPRCAVFGRCGGCVFQEWALEGQRRAKAARALADVAGAGDRGLGQVHPVRGAPDAYGYRNKVELSFGTRRYLSDADHAAGLPLDGRYLGFHAPGRFDRVVDATRCELVSEPMNAVLGVVRSHALQDDAPPPYDARAHTGFWRHLVLREGQRTGEILVVLHTTTPDDDASAAVARLAEATRAADGVVGVVWRIHDGVADVAAGGVHRTWGRGHLVERLGGVAFQIQPQTFFQTSTAGAALLYDTVGEALGRGGTLVDLYCGTGAIGLYLADRHDRLVGLEAVPEAVEDAKRTAAAHGIEGTWLAAKVEDALDTLASTDPDARIVVDPPRVGLHPKVAARLAEVQAAVLVYVACNPASLGRDRVVLEAGGWRLTDTWVVDLFPQTGHTEVVARFVRDA